jgi:hypothetical protein
LGRISDHSGKGKSIILIHISEWSDLTRLRSDFFHFIISWAGKGNAQFILWPDIVK